MQSASKRGTIHQGLNEGFLIKQRSVWMGTMTEEWDVAGCWENYTLLFISKFTPFFSLSVSYKFTHILPISHMETNTTHRHSVRTELLRCLTMSLLLASANRMKSNCQTLPLYLMLMVSWVHRLTETDLYLGHTQSCSGLTAESWSGGQSRHLPLYLLQCFFWSSLNLFVVIFLQGKSLSPTPAFII